MLEVDFFKLRKRNVFAIMLIMLLVVLLVPTLSRFYVGNSSFVGSEPYYHYHITNELSKTGSVNIFDPPGGVEDKSYSERDVVFTPFHYLLAYLSYFISLAGAIRVLPLILGILSVLVFNMILKRFIDVDYKRHVILLLLVINPAFIYAFTVANPHCAAIFFTLLGFYLFMIDGKLFFWLSAMCFIVLSFFSLFNILLALLLIFSYVLYSRKRYNRMIVLFLFTIIASFASKVSLYYNYTYTPKLNILSNLFSDLGGFIGFGIFTIILAWYSIFSGWKNKSAFFPFFVLGLVLFFSLFIVGNIANMYLAFFVAFAAGVGLVRLYETDWAVKELRNLTLLVLFCGLLFSCASYVNRLAVSPPYESDIDALAWLGSNSFKDGFVLSSYQNGYFISTVARNPVLADSFASSSYDQRFLYKIQDSIFESRKLLEVTSLLDSYNIDYVYVDEAMRSGQVWSRDGEGLLFVLRDKEHFEKVYDEGGVTIWRVISPNLSGSIV